MMMKRLLSLTLLGTLLLGGCGTEATVKPADPALTTAPTEFIGTEPAEEATAAVMPTQEPTETPLISVSVLPDRCQLPVDSLYQEPELPAGCEITSLTCLLNYLGFPVDKEVMADTYLDIVLEDATNYTFFEKYIGDPRSNGYGCYSPVIMKAATDFLADQNSDLEAVNLSGSTREELLLVIASGHPIVIWNTVDCYPVSQYIAWTTSDGEDVYWCVLEHCMLLTGYDMAKGTVTVCDPLKGKVEYKMNQFFEVYDDLYQQAVTIY
ncbi:MAG: C39 family peptidase [Ruminococcus sp.]|nr:C39 family peptidase [Ruminococcus sp.]